MNTPWGKSQQSEQLAPGITFHSTARHGGIKVSFHRNQQIPEYMRNEDGWYEEDCEWCKVYIVFSREFKRESVLKAIDTFRNWFWKEYELFYDVKLAPGTSSSKDEHTFLRNCDGKYRVLSASRRDDGMVEVYAGKIDLNKVPAEHIELWRNYVEETKTFLVPKEEYKAVPLGHFVVDKAKHREIKEGL